MSGEPEINLEYENEVSELLFRDSLSHLWNEKKYNAVYKEFKFEYGYIKGEQPDLVIVVGEIEGALYSSICDKLGIPLIIYIAGGDMTANEEVIDLWKNCETICFSKENADVIRRHFDDNHINVISNRINISGIFEDLRTKYNNPQSELNFLICSRLDNGKMKSIYSFLNMLRMDHLPDVTINVRIAGDGTFKEELEAYCKNNCNENIRINMLGYLSDLTEEFRWAHVVAGKGRSVIEPIMMNRIGCVIGEKGDLAFCNKKTFENLYHFNFAGRNLETKDSKAELQSMIYTIKQGTVNCKDIIEISDLMCAHYSVEYLPKQVNRVINKLHARRLTHGISFLLVQYIRLVCKKAKGKIKWIWTKDTL